MTYLRNMINARDKGDTAGAVDSGVAYLAQCLAEVSMHRKMATVLDIPYSESVTRQLTVLVITLVSLADDEDRFKQLLATARKFLDEDMDTSALWELFHDYDFDGGSDAGTTQHAGREEGN